MSIYLSILAEKRTLVIDDILTIFCFVVFCIQMKRLSDRLARRMRYIFSSFIGVPVSFDAKESGGKKTVALKNFLRFYPLLERKSANSSLASARSSNSALFMRSPRGEPLRKFFKATKFFSLYTVSFVMLVGVVLPWSSKHPWSQAILYRRFDSIRQVSCEPLRCMNGAFVPTCDMYRRPIGYIVSPCRGR